MEQLSRRAWTGGMGTIRLSGIVFTEAGDMREWLKKYGVRRIPAAL